MHKFSILIIFFLWMSCFIYAQDIETWNYHIEFENDRVPQVWKHEFQRSTTDMEDILSFEEYPKTLGSFYNETAEDGLYVFFSISKENNVKIYYFQVEESEKYLISYVEEGINVKNPGLFLYQIFYKTYPVALEISEGVSNSPAVRSVTPGQVFYNQEYILCQTNEKYKLTVDYMDEEEEEAVFQANEMVNGVYRRIFIDELGKIDLSQSINLSRREWSEFTFYYCYGWNSRLYNTFWTPYSFPEFTSLALRRTLPITIFIVHKQQSYMPLMLRTNVPLLGSKVENFQTILQIDEENFTQPMNNFEVSGKTDTKFQFQRKNAKIELQLVDLKENVIKYGNSNEGSGKIEIFNADGNKISYKGKTSFRPPRISTLMLDFAEYTFTYTPFNTKKFVVQSQKISIKKQQNIRFIAYQRIPYYFYTLDKNLFEILEPLFSKEEVELYISNIEQWSEFFDLLREKNASNEVWENFLHTLINLYEKNKKELDTVIPSDHPHRLMMYFDLAEAYWRCSEYSQTIPNLEKALQIIFQEKITFKDFIQKWCFRGNKIADVKSFSRNLFTKRPGLFKEARYKWDRYRSIYCLGAILSHYYKAVYKDISDETSKAFGAAIITLSQCFKMKQERNIALGEERPGLDYNIATYLSDVLELTYNRAQSTNSWTVQQKEEIGFHFYESETKHLVYSSLAYLEALSDEIKRPDRWDLHIIPANIKQQIKVKCTSERRKTLENFVNEILRKWHKKN